MRRALFLLLSSSIAAHASSPIALKSAAFAEGAPIPRTYSGEGEDRSPPLAWQGVPTGARELAILCEDPDAPGGTWIHWVLFGLSPTLTALPAGLPATATLTSPVTATQGTNSFDRVGYGGPLPPPGSPPHHYLFRLYALDAGLSLSGGATATAFRTAIRGHVLAEGRLTGTYRR